MPELTFSELEALPTLSVGQAADLKLENYDVAPPVRVWVSRCGLRDGETCPVQIEHLIEGRWVDVSPSSGYKSFHVGNGLFITSYRRKFV